MTKEAQIIPFGKYKGQPLEVLQNDKQYVEWLRNQSWFIQNHPTINTLIINNFSEATDSPEHNRLQARFLDDYFCQKFFEKCLLPYVRLESSCKGAFDGHYRHDVYLDHRFKNCDFEVNNIDVGFYYEYTNYVMKTEITYELGKQINNFGYASKSYSKECLELKPCIGDDYPSILRKILADKKCDYCVAETYTGTGATKEQVIEIFKRARIKLIFLPDIGL